MSDSLGWIGVPIVPTFAGVGAKLSAGLTKPAAKAGKEATKEIEKSTTELVKNLDRQVSASAANVKKTERAVQDAMAKRESASHKVTAATLEQELAEKKYQEALKSGGNGLAEKAKVEKAIAKVSDETLKSVKAARDAEDAQRKHDAQLKDLKDTTERYEEAQKSLGDELDDSSSSLDRLGDKFAGLGESMKSGLNKITTGAFLGVGAKIGTALMSGVQEVVSGGWDTAMSLDQVSRSLGAMTSETKVAEQMMVDLRKVSANKPVDYTAFLGAANTLAYMGYEGEEAVKVLDNIATAATGAGNDGTEALEAAAGALGKMQANGKVTQEEIATISGQGVPMLDMLIEHFGMAAGSYGELKDKISSGGVELEDVFQALGGTGAESFQMLSASADNMNQSLGSQMQILKDNLNVSVGEALQPILNELDFEEISESIGDIAGKLIELLPLVIDVGLWAADNIHWIAPLAGVLAGIAGAIWLVNLAMAANPVVLTVAGIAAAIAGLVATLTWFFTQTEIGQKIWATFTAAIGDSWDWLVEKFHEGWEWLRDSVLQPVADFFTVTLWGAIQSATAWIGDSWSALVDRFVGGWNWLKEAVFTAFQNVISALANWVLDRLGDIQAAWDYLGNFLHDVWNFINQYVIEAFMSGLDRLKDFFLGRVEVIKGLWSGMSDSLHNVWLWLSKNVFDRIGSTLETVKGWFRSGVDNIASIWDGLREKLATPINFVIETVYTGGIKKVFDGVSDKVGLDARLPSIQKIGGFAQGTARVPGARTRHDNVHMISQDGRFSLSLRGDESVLVPEVTDVLGERTVNDLNRLGLTQGRAGVARYLEHMGSHSEGGVIRGPKHLGGFANGGFTNLAGALSAVQASHGQFVGRYFPDLFNLTSAMRFTDTGHHSTGKATDWQAKDGQFASQMPTPASKALAQAFYRVFPNTAELIHYPLDGWQNLSNGRPYDFGPATNAQHGNHVHFASHGPLEYDASKSLDDIGVGFSGGAAADPEASWGFWGKILDKLPSFNLQGYGDVAKWPGAALKTLGSWVKDWAVDQLKEWAGRFLDFFGSPGAGVEQWRDVASEALKRMGYGDEYLDIMLQQIGIESNGDPRAVNLWDSNYLKGTPSGGLLQVIEPTYRDVRNKYPSAFEGLPDDRFHPLTNLTAGVGAVKRDWGGPAGRWPTKDGYADGGIINLDNARLFDTGGILRNGGAAVNLSGADEVIINNEQLTALSKLGNNVGLLVRQLAVTGNVDRFVEGLSAEFTPYLDKTNDWLEQVANPATVEGVTARQIARRTLGLGIDIPGSEVLTALLDGEIAIGDARARQVDHLKSIADAQEAYDEALRVHQETLDAGAEGMSDADSKRLADAEKAVDDAVDAEARKKAEEDLAKIREELEKSSLESAKNWAAGIEKANTDVLVAGENLAKAREAQVQDLDHLIVLSQESVESLIPEVRKLADQLLGMGAPATLVSQGLGAVTGALGAVSALAGPAGISLGMAFDLLKVAMSLFDLLRRVIEEFFDKIADARRAARKGLVDFYDELVNMAEIVAKYQHINSTYTQELARLNNEITLSSFELAKSIRDGFREVGQAERDMFSERARLNELFENAQIASQLKARGLMEDISTAFQFHLDAANQATVEMTDEMWEAYWSYEASRARFEQAKLQRDLGMLNAEFALEQARRDSLRWQEDINAQLQRSAALLAQANGIDLGEATLGKMTSETLLELFEVQEQRKDAEGLLGLGNLFRKEEIAGLRNQEAYLREQLFQMAQEGGTTLTEADVDRILKELAKTSFLGGDPAMALKGLMPELASQLNAADSYQRWEPYYTVLDQQRERDRSLEDLEFDLEQFNKTFPLEQQIAGWESIASGFDALSMSYGQNLSDEERASLRKEFAQEIGWSVAHTGIKPALDEAFANIRDQVPDTVQVVVEGGRLYSEEDVLAIVDGALETVGVKTRAELVTSTELARSRRTPRV